jgi:hypothetical protein
VALLPQSLQLTVRYDVLIVIPYTDWKQRVLRVQHNKEEDQ